MQADMHENSVIGARFVQNVVLKPLALKVICCVEKIHFGVKINKRRNSHACNGNAPAKLQSLLQAGLLF
jgi:hypothetical protein